MHHLLTLCSLLLIAGAACGDDHAAPLLAKLPVRAVHGDQDSTVMVGRSRSMIAALKQAGGSPKYDELAGVRHNAWDRALATPGLLPWLFAQQRH